MDMQGAPAGIPVEALLEHRGWVRALARGLAADEAGVDDLEQETWLTAIRRPPAHGAGIRAWLARVVRSRAADAARSAGARAKREQGVARTELEPSTVRLALAAELQARVARAVLDLEEPYRSTVLLRYFEGLPLGTVAARMRSPLETVRTRLRRAHERLRERLDRDHGGDRRAWLLLLAFPARGEESSIPVPVVPGGLLLTLKAKAAVAAASILFLVLAARLLGPEAPPPAPPPIESAAARPAPAPEPAPDAPPPPPAVIVAEPAPPSPAAPEPETALGEKTIPYLGRVLDDRRRPVPGAEVTLGIRGRVVDGAKSDGEGRFELRAPPRPRGSPLLNAALRAVAHDGRVGVRAVGWWFSPSEWVSEILVSPPLPLAVRVEDAKGPVAGASVELWLRNGLLEKGTTAADGLLTLAPLPSRAGQAFGSGDLLVLAHAPGRGSADAEVPWPPASTEPLSLRLTSQELEVRVVDAESGAGIEGAAVRVSRRFGDDGPTLQRPSHSSITGPEGAATVRGLSAQGQYMVSAGAEGYGAVADGESGAWLFLTPERPVRITLGRSRTMRWPVTDADGPVPPDGTAIRLEQGTRTFSARAIAMGAPRPMPAVEGRIERGRPEGDWLVVEGLGGGMFLGGRPPLGHLFTAVAPDGRRTTLRTPYEGPSGPPISFRAPCSVMVLVRDENGAPRPGVEVLVEGTGRGRQVVTEYATTDASGVASISDLAGGSVLVRLRDPHAYDFGEAPAGKLDLEAGDARLEAVLPALRPVEILVRMRMQGEPRLPPEFNVYILQGSRGSPCERLAEDPVAGTVRFTAWLPRPAEEFRVGVHCPGAPPGVTVPAGSRERAVEVSLEIASAPPPPPPVAEAPRERPNPALPGETKDQRNRRILDTERFSFEPGDSKMTLAVLVQFLSAHFGFNIFLDSDVEKEAGHLEVRASFKDLPLGDALREILRVRADLTFVLRDGCVVVVTK